MWRESKSTRECWGKIGEEESFRASKNWEQDRSRMCMRKSWENFKLLNSVFLSVLKMYFKYFMSTWTFFLQCFILFFVFHVHHIISYFTFIFCIQNSQENVLKNVNWYLFMHVCSSYYKTFAILHALYFLLWRASKSFSQISLNWIFLSNPLFFHAFTAAAAHSNYYSVIKEEFPPHIS